MSAHLRDLDLSCGNAWCSRRAAVEVLDTWNESYGRFCRPCGENRVKDLDESYAKAERTRREPV